MQVNKITLTLLSCIVALFNTNSHAESSLFSERNYYIGLGVSQFNGKSRELEFGDFTSPTLVVGANLNPYFGLEFRASGKSNSKRANDNKKYKLESHYGGYVLAKYPFKPDKFSGHIRLGVSNLKITTGDNVELKANGKLSYGLGFQLKISKHFSFALDYEQVLDDKVDGYDTKVDSISLMLHRHF